MSYRRHSLLRFAAWGLSFFLFAACKQDVAFEHRSEVIELPPSSPWKTASFLTRYTPKRTSVHGSSNPEVGYYLAMNDGQKEHIFYLEDFTLRTIYGDLPSREFNKLADATALLAASADGKNIIFSIDQGKSWKFIAIGSDPPLEMATHLYCPHRSFPGEGSGRPDWSKIPPLRDWVLEILHQKDPPTDLKYSHLGFADSFPYKRFTYEKELTFAINYACQHLADRDLRAALVDAFVLPDSPAGEAGSIDCAHKAILQDIELFAKVEASLNSEDPSIMRQRIRAAKIAEAFENEKSQDLIAVALENWQQSFMKRLQKIKDIQKEEDKRLHFSQSPRWPFGAESMLCGEGRSLLRSLISLIHGMGKASSKAERTLAKFAQLKSLCTPGEERTGRDMQGLAIVSLKFLDSPTAKASLQETAKGDCPDGDSAYFANKSYEEALKLPYNIQPAPCYAKAALAAWNNRKE